MTTALPDAQLTHIGLYVTDMDAMVAFYTQALGLMVSDSGEHTGRRLCFLSRNADEHHQLVLVTGRNADRASVALLSQVSFRVDGLAALKHFRRHVVTLGATNLEDRNHGNSWSIYFEDPEGNRVEMYTTTPWHVQQPWRTPMDLDAPDEQIVAETRAAIETAASWEPREQWVRREADRLASTKQATDR
jgi:catechol 2,3-dioxygenase